MDSDREGGKWRATEFLSSLTKESLFNYFRAIVHVLAMNHIFSERFPETSASSLGAHCAKRIPDLYTFAHFCTLAQDDRPLHLLLKAPDHRRTIS